MGSKARIAKYILPIILKDRKPGQYYVEPFCGGCNSIDKVADGPRIAADINPYLIALWIALQWGRKFTLDIPKPDYDVARTAFNTRRGTDRARIGWIGYMASLGGRFFDGGYSITDSSGRDYVRERANNILSQMPLLRDVDFRCGSYDEIEYPPASLIYCDIPYEGTKQYAYSKDFDYAKFWDWCRTMRVQGHTIFVSEYKAPEDFVCVWEKQVTNAMNATKTYRPVERLFTLR